MPDFSAVAAVPRSEKTDEDNTERKDETGEDVDNEERMEEDVVSNNVESDPKNTYLQVSINLMIIVSSNELLIHVRSGSG